MNIYINGVGGAVVEMCGLPDHLSMVDHLERAGYTVYPDAAIPRGDYGDYSAIMCCRRADGGEYAAGEYDVAVAVQ